MVLGASLGRLRGMSTHEGRLRGGRGRSILRGNHYQERIAMSDELAELRARVARLEAERAVISTFNEYFYNMDIGYTDGILDVFHEDALLEVINFPPGTMDDLRFEGRAAMRELYGPHSSAEPTLSGGHHSANVQVNVADDCSSAELSAYFMTSGGHGGLGGGMYQGTFVPDGDKWRISHYRIISNWGWSPDEWTKRTESLPASKAKRGGKPPVYEFPKQPVG